MARLKVLEVKRVVYGKDSTPLGDREYKIKGVPNSPVGNIEEMLDFANKRGYHKVEFEDFGETFSQFTEKGLK